MAVASVAQAHGAEGISLGAIGTRQGDLAPRLRTRPATATHRSVVSEAGPWGSWRSRPVPTHGSDGWGVAPSRVPPKAGDRATPDRRDARHLARRARLGERPVVDVPHVDDAAIRDRTRAREETRSDRQDAKLRRTAC
ncbi:MAG: hypothetical protein ACRERE_05440 [Candidatus Entotheonellia bacterium]